MLTVFFVFFSLLLSSCHFHGGQKDLRADDTDYRKPGYIFFSSCQNEQQAEEWWKKISEQSNDTLAIIQLGHLLLIEGYENEAINLLEFGIRHNPTAVKLYHGLASAHQYRAEKSDLMTSIQILEEAATMAPRNVYTHLKLGYGYQKSKRAKEAAKHFYQVLDLTTDPQMVLSAHLGLVAHFQNLEDEEHRKFHLTKATKINPNIEKSIEHLSEIESIGSSTPPPVYGGAGIGDGIHEKPYKRSNRLIKLFREKQICQKANS